MVTTNLDVHSSILTEDLENSGFESFLVLRLEKAGAVSALKDVD
jgi:hypothetical protein